MSESKKSIGEIIDTCKTVDEYYKNEEEWYMINKDNWEMSEEEYNKCQQDHILSFDNDKFSFELYHLEKNDYKIILSSETCSLYFNFEDAIILEKFLKESIKKWREIKNVKSE